MCWAVYLVSAPTSVVGRDCVVPTVQQRELGAGIAGKILRQQLSEELLRISHAVVDFTVRHIVSGSIAEHKNGVIHKLLWGGVAEAAALLQHCLEVHRFLDDLVVVWHLFLVYGFQEGPT